LNESAKKEIKFKYPESGVHISLLVCYCIKTIFKSSSNSLFFNLLSESRHSLTVILLVSFGVLSDFVF